MSSDWDIQSLIPAAAEMTASSDIKCDPYFLPTVQYLSRPLAPLVSVTTLLPAPDFPSTILAYHVLTSDQLDNLAQHYHQVWPPVPGTFCYPLFIPAWVGTPEEDQVDVATKRRRFGHFIGLRGCESPADDADYNRYSEDMLEEMEREWQSALLAEDDDGVILKEKRSRY
ncbi:hypothetical protein V8E54_001430 [Elaphomyces granulatus]